MKRHIPPFLLSNAIQDDKERGVFRVNRRVFTDEDIFDIERSAIFETCWLYAAHESEIAAKGAFISRNVGGKPLIVNRDRNGKVHVFFNTCPHRGATVCREESGKAKTFSCPYHGWVFNDEGKTINIPIATSYSPACKEDPSLNLSEVPHFDIFAGFIFVNFAANCDTLETYLAGAAPYLKNIEAQDREAMVILGGVQTYSARANWKLLQENSADGYHAATTHSTYFDYIRNREGSIRDNFTQSGFGCVRNLGNGHAISESLDGTPWGRPLARWINSWGEALKADVNEAYAEMEARVGPERAKIICHGDRNMLIFPNLVINDIMGIVIRTYYPTSPSYFEVNSFSLAPKNEKESLRELRHRNFLEFLGPAGFATPDDQEMLESCQRSYATHKYVQWNDLSRGMLLEDQPNPAKQDELQMRTFWRRWYQLMAEATGEVNA